MVGSESPEPIYTQGGDLGVAKTLKKLYLLALSHGDALFYQHRLNTILQHVRDKKLREWAKQTTRPLVAGDDNTSISHLSMPELVPWKGVLDGLSTAAITENASNVLNVLAVDGFAADSVHEVLRNRSRLLSFSALNDFLMECGFYESISTQVSPTFVRSLWIKIADRRACRIEPNPAPTRLPPTGLRVVDLQLSTDSTFKTSPSYKDMVPLDVPDRPRSQLAFLLEGHEELVHEMQTRVQADPHRRRSMRRESVGPLDMSPAKVLRRHEVQVRRKGKRNGFGREGAASRFISVAPPRRAPPNVSAWTPKSTLSTSSRAQHHVDDDSDEDEKELPISTKEVSLFFKQAMDKGIRGASTQGERSLVLGRNAPPVPQPDALLPLDANEDRISEFEFAQLLLIVVMRSSAIYDCPEDAWAHGLANHFEGMYRSAISPTTLPLVLNKVGTVAPRGLRVCQTVLYDLLRTHMDWLLLPLFRAYLLVDKRQMDSHQWMHLMGDIALPNMDGNRAYTIFVDANQHDTEGMLTGTVAEALEFDEFLDALMTLASAEFGDESKYPTLLSCQSQMWELLRWLRRVYGILEAGSTTPCFNHAMVGKRPPLVSSRLGTGPSKEGSPSPFITKLLTKAFASNSRTPSLSRPQTTPFGQDTTSMSAILTAHELYIEYLTNAVSEALPACSLISLDTYYNSSSLLQSAFSTLTPVGPSGECDRKAITRLRELDVSMMLSVTDSTSKKDRLWDAVACRGFGNDVNITSIMDGLKGGARDAKGPSLPPRLTMVYPPRLCIDEVSSFLLGGVFLPDLDELALKAIPPARPLEYTEEYEDEDDDDAGQPPIPIVCTTPHRVPTRPTDAPRTQPRAILIDTPSMKMSSSSKSILPPTSCMSNELVMRQPVLRNTRVIAGARNVRDLVDEKAVDELYLERLESQGRPTTGGGLLPCAGYDLDAEIAEFKKLKHKQNLQVRPSGSDASSYSASKAPSIANTSIAHSNTPSRQSAQSAPIKITVGESSSIKGVGARSPQGTSVGGRDEALHMGTSKSMACPVSVHLGPNGVTATATQVDRNRWQVSFDIEDIDYGSLLPVVEVEERVIHEAVGPKRHTVNGGGHSMREPGMMTPQLLEQSAQSFETPQSGALPMFAPISDDAFKLTQQDVPLHPLGVSMRDGSTRSLVADDSPLLMDNTATPTSQQKGPRCVAYSFKTRQSLAWKVKLSPKALHSDIHCGDSQHVVLELTHTKDKLTVYQSQWLKGLFDQFCDPSTNLLTASAFMENTLPRFRRFPVVLGVPSTLQPASKVGSPRRGGNLPPARSRPNPVSPPTKHNNIEKLFTLFTTRDIGAATHVKLGEANQLEIHHVLKSSVLPPTVKAQRSMSPVGFFGASPSPMRREKIVGIVEDTPSSLDAAKPNMSPIQNRPVDAPQAKEAGVNFSGFLLFIIYAILGKKAQGGLDQSPTDFVTEVESMIPTSETESVVWLESNGINSALASNHRRTLTSSSGPRNMSIASGDSYSSSATPQLSQMHGLESVPFFPSYSPIPVSKFDLNPSHHPRFVSRDSVGSVLLSGSRMGSVNVIDATTSAPPPAPPQLSPVPPTKVSFPKALTGALKSGRRGSKKVPQVKLPPVDASILEPVVVPQQLCHATTSMSAYHRALSFRSRSIKESRQYGAELVSRVRDVEEDTSPLTAIDPLSSAPLRDDSRPRDARPVEPWQQDTTLATGSVAERWDALFKGHAAHVQQVSQSSGATVMMGFFGASMSPRPPTNPQGMPLF